MQTRTALKNVKDAVAHVDVDAVTEQAQTAWDKLKNLPQNVGEDEKRLSLIGGAVIGGLGLTRLSHASGWLMLGVGAALIARGTTGKCGLYSAMGIDTKHE